MSVYSIKDLEHLSGIKAHTIRIWEQRYNLFSPQRTTTNIRFYNEDDLRLVLNISILRNHGLKISKIIGLSLQEINEKVHHITTGNTSNTDQIFALTRAMVEMDELQFDRTLNQNIERYGIEKAMMNIVYPFMHKIGILWMTNAINPAQEHFISHLVRQKIISATDQLSPSTSGPLFFLFLPEGELHELGILLANFILRARGMRTIFFGQTVPINALEEVYHKLKPSHILTSMTTKPDPSEMHSYLLSLDQKFKKAQILITGSQVIGQDLKIPGRITILNSFNSLEKVIEHAKLQTSIA